MQYYDAEYKCKVTITCDGKPLEGPYIPPLAETAALGRYLASKYAAKDAQLPGYASDGAVTRSGAESKEKLCQTSI